MKRPIKLRGETISFLSFNNHHHMLAAGTISDIYEEVNKYLMKE